MGWVMIQFALFAYGDFGFEQGKERRVIVPDCETGNGVTHGTVTWLS